MRNLLLCALFVFSFTGVKQSKVADTIKTNPEIKEVEVDTAAYSVPISTALDKPAEAMKRLNQEAKEVYKISIKLSNQVKTQAVENKLDSIMDKINNQKPE